MPTSNSRLLARLLHGSWRPNSEPIEFSAAQWETFVPLLVGSGAGALGWRCVRDTTLRDAAIVKPLREAHHEQALRSQLQMRDIAQIFALLQQHDVSALLLKGWSCARLYPEAGLRPLGDIDILVHPSHKTIASQVLGVPLDDESEVHWVDAKSKLRPLYGFDEAAVWQARCEADLRGVPVGILCAEDQLRMLCLHFLRHGAWRPLWLCDIAVALEARTPAFDWSRCLGTDARRADAIACALGLAHQLLGANLEDTPLKARALPSWLVPAVLQQWENPVVVSHLAPPLFRDSWRQGELFSALLQRWPNPIEAAIVQRAPLDRRPLPSQMRYFARRTLHFLKQAS